MCSINSYGLLHRKIERDEFINGFKLYNPINLKKLELMFKEMVIKNINEYFEKRNIRIQ